MMELYLSILAFLVSAVSLWLSLDRNSIARRALEISQKEAAKKEANFSLYLIDSFRYMNQDDVPYLVYNVTITNKSSSSNTFKAVVEIEYKRPDDSDSKLILQHNPNLLDEVKTGSITTFDENISIRERGIESKWLLFKFPSNFDQNNRISKYNLVVIGTDNEKQNYEVYLMKDVKHVQE